MISNHTIKLVIFISLFWGCREEDPVLFEMPFMLTFEMPAGLNPLDRHYFTVKEVPTHLLQLKDQFGVDESQNITIKPASAIFTSVLQNLTFEFIEEIRISIYQDDIEDDELVFLTDFIPGNAGRNVNVGPFEDDVSSYFTKSTINFKVGFRFRTPTPTFVDGRVDIKFVAQ